MQGMKKNMKNDVVSFEYCVFVISLTDRYSISRKYVSRMFRM